MVLYGAGLQDYETVSYVWGDPTPRRKIRIDGEVRRIPRNADMALRTLALPNKPRVLWIDAICINQADPKERATQVALMGQIYSNTAQNLIYLGPTSSKTAHVKSVIEDFRAAIQPLLGDHSITSWLRELYAGNNLPTSGRSLDIELTSARSNSTWTMHFHQSLERGSFLKFPTEGKSLPEGKPLQSMSSEDSGLRRVIMENPWFGRAWTLQEAVLPSTSLCFLGNQTFPLDHLLEVVTWLSLVRGEFLDLRLRFSYGIRSIVTLFEFRSKFEKEKHVGLNSLMKISNQRQASDIRDMVFGTLGLSQSNVDRLPDLLAPDYTKSVQQVFRDATKAALLSQPSGVEILYEVHNGKDSHEEEFRGLIWGHPTLSDEHTSGRPSWVPDWMRLSADGSPPRGLDSHWSGWKRLPYVPADNTNVEVNPISDDRPETLLLRGSVIDRIRHVSPVFDFKQSSVYALYYGLLRGLGATPHTKMRVESFADESRLTFMECFTEVMRWYERSIGAASSDPSTIVPVWRLARTMIADTTLHGTRSVRKDLNGFLEPWNSAPGGVAALFWEAARRTSADRRLAMTDNGLFVLASCGTKPDDIVVRVEGGAYPLILREVDGDEYILVEHCYVDGMMPWQEDGDIAPRVLRLFTRTFRLR